MTTPNKSPRTQFREAVSTFVQDANNAMDRLQEGAQLEVARAQQAEREALQQRDSFKEQRDMLKFDMLSLSLEVEGVKRQVEYWKGRAGKFEWKAGHQQETLASLKRESLDWKDQFLRAQDERSNLSDLVTRQLYSRQESSQQAPLTPRSQAGQEPSGSAMPHRTVSRNRMYYSPSSAPPADEGGYLPDRESSRQPSSVDHRPQSNAVSRNQTPVPSTHRQSGSNSPHSAKSQHMPQTKVIRRVHAIVDVPIKEERMDTDDEELLSLVESRSPSYQHRKSHDYVPSDAAYENEQYEEGGEGDDGNASDEEVPNTRADDEDEDELMLGVEGARNEVYGLEHVTDARSSSRKMKHSRSSGKRKEDSYISASTDKKHRRR